METPEGDLYYNYGFGDYCLRMAGIYYRLRIGQGWSIIGEDQLPADTKRNKMHHNQHEVYTEALKKDGLLKE